MRSSGYSSQCPSQSKRYIREEKQKGKHNWKRRNLLRHALRENGDAAAAHQTTDRNTTYTKENQQLIPPKEENDSCTAGIVASGGPHGLVLRRVESTGE